MSRAMDEPDNTPAIDGRWFVNAVVVLVIVAVTVCTFFYLRGMRRNREARQRQEMEWRQNAPATTAPVVP